MSENQKKRKLEELEKELNQIDADLYGSLDDGERDELIVKSFHKAAWLKQTREAVLFKYLSPGVAELLWTKLHSESVPTHPLLNETISSTEVMSSWRRAGKVEAVDSLLKARRLADQAERFNQIWSGQAVQEKVQSIRIELCPIVNETNDGLTCYQQFAALLESLAPIFILPSGKLTTFCNEPAENRLRPDIMGVIHSVQVQPQRQDMLRDGNMVVEGKPRLDAECQTDGLAQLIGRSTKMRKAKDVTSYMLAGGLTDNRAFMPVVVQTVKPGQPDSWLIHGPCLQLLQRPPPAAPGQDSSGAAPSSETARQQAARVPVLVDTSGPGVQEAAFTLFIGVDNATLKASADRTVVCLRPDECVTIRSTTGAALQVVVDSVLSAPGPSGCVYNVTQAGASRSDASNRLVMKVGPPLILAQQAIALGRPRSAWTQVDRDSDTRQRLGNDLCPGLPRTVFLGHLERVQQGQEAATPQHVQQHVLHGVAVVLMEHVGQPLMSRGAQEYPRLAPAELDAMIGDLMVPLLFLQFRGFTHLDVCPWNIARATPTRFCLMDLGTTCSEDDWKQQDWQPPISYMFSCYELLFGDQPGPLADLQSLIFVAVTLGGVRLPWADERDSLNAYAQRIEFMQCPGDLPGWGDLFSDELRLVLERVLTTALKDPPEQQKLLQSLSSK